MGPSSRSHESPNAPLTWQVVSLLLRFPGLGNGDSVWAVLWAAGAACWAEPEGSSNEGFAGAAPDCPPPPCTSCPGLLLYYFTSLHTHLTGPQVTPHAMHSAGDSQAHMYMMPANDTAPDFG